MKFPKAARTRLRSIAGAALLSAGLLTVAAPAAQASHLQGGFFTASLTADGHLKGNMTYLERRACTSGVGSLMTQSVTLTSPTGESVSQPITGTATVCRTSEGVYELPYDYTLSGVFSNGTPDGNYTISWSSSARISPIANLASPGAVSLSAQVHKVSGQTTSAPVLGSNAATGISVVRQDPQSLNASDPDGGTLTYRTALNNPPGGSTALTDPNAPDSDIVAIDANGVLSIPQASTFAPGAFYVYKLRVTDSQGDFADRDVLMTVAPAGQAPPTIHGLDAEYTVQPGETKVITFTADDTSTSPNPVTLSPAGLPSWATLTQTTGNPATATLTLAPPASLASTVAGINVDATTVAQPPLTSTKTLRVVVQRPSDPPVSTTAPTTTTTAAPAVAPIVPTVPPCEKRYEFGTVKIESSTCFAIENGLDGKPARWVSTGNVKVNGLPVTPLKAGTKFIITLPTVAQPRPRVTDDNASIALSALNVYAGKIDWLLPTGTAADLKVPGATSTKVSNDDGIRTLQTQPVASAATLMGLKLRGQLAIKVGKTDDGKFFTTLPLTLEMPSTFRSGPDVNAGGVTANASLRIDDAGVHFDGLRLIVKQVWMGKLRVEEACISYVPAGGQSGEPCEAPELDGKPYITCNSDSNANRWDGNAVIILPTKTETKLAAFGGVSNGSISKLGGFVDNLGNKVPVATGVYLNRVGLGLCINPPPFKLRGDVGVSVFPTAKDELLGINGHILYTDAYNGHPWSLELGGSVEVYDKLIGTGSLTIRPTGALDFDVASGFSLFGVVSVNGRLEGWLETSTKKFDIEGRARACLTSICATADAVASSTGMGGCATVATIVYYYPVRASNWKWYAPWRINWIRGEIPIRGGFGHRWKSGNVQMLGNSCDFGPYRAQRTAGLSAAGDAKVHIAKGTPAIALQLKGAQDQAPTVTLHGPKGEELAVPVDEPAKKFDNGSMIIKNTTDGSTSVLLVQPSAGTWTISTPSGSPRITQVLTSAYEPPATVQANVHALRGGLERISTAYTLPEGATLSYVEKGAGVQRTLVKRVSGTTCPGAKKSPDGRSVLCHTVDFRPTAGPGGTRKIIAVVERDGLPLSQKTVATFRAPKQSLPATPRRLRMVRFAKWVVAAWDKDASADRYSVAVSTGTGQKYGRLLPAGCKSIALPIAAGTAVKVSVAGVRDDLAVGARNHGALKATQKRSGATPRLPRKQWVKRTACR
ncbi:MAG TPA: hypothetical protein VNT55_14290 [Baekduia sp.]|nr:hypothetical protein [Baekduia sp.]